MCVMLPRRLSAAYNGLIAAPGIPNAMSIPSRSITRTAASAAVIFGIAATPSSVERETTASRAQSTAAAARRASRCRRVSYRHSAAATETFRLSTWPNMGMRTRASQRSRVSRRNPAPSAPERPGERAVEPRREQALGALFRGAEDPDAGSLQRLDGAREVGDRDQWNAFRGAAGHLGHYRRQARGAVLGHDHGVHPHRVGHPQAGSQVVGIGHPVEQQQEGGLRQPLEQFVEVHGTGHRLDPRHDSLVARVAGKTRETGIVHCHDADAARLGQRGQLAQARIVALGIDVDLAHAVGLVAQPRGDCVKSHQQALFRDSFRC